MASDENQLLTSLVEVLETKLKALEKGEGQEVVGYSESGSPIYSRILDDQLEIGKFLLKLASSRTAASQGWVRLSGEMGREKMMEVLQAIQGRKLIGSGTT